MPGEEQRTPFLSFPWINTKHNKDPSDSGCCGVPLISWNPKKKAAHGPGDQQGGHQDSTMKNTAETQGEGVGVRESIYRLFSCEAPLACTCRGVCQSSYSRSQVLKGPRIPNTVYTEVVVAEPRRSCFGWFTGDNGTQVQRSPIYKLPTEQGCSSTLPRATRDVVTSAPRRSGSDSNLSKLVNNNEISTSSTSLNTSPRKSKKVAQIPWSTEFKSRSVVIENMESEELQESDVVFGQSQLSAPLQTEAEPLVASPLEGLSDLSDDESFPVLKTVTDGKSSSRHMRIPSDQSEAVEADITDHIGGIPLTPYSLNNESWNGRLELMDAEKSKS